MRRLVEQQLQKWANSPRRKPLLIRGARQVGKTFSVKELGKTNFENTVVVDLERNHDWHKIFEPNLDAKRIVSELELVTGNKIMRPNTLLFLDEIQACPRAIMALRYFYEEIPELHVIAAGSLLDFALSEISIPVGRIQYLEIYPMTFVEYLWASGNHQVAQVLLQPPKPLPDSTHQFLLNELKKYLFVGGMPECVLTYQTSKSIQEAFEVQKEVCDSYRQDFSKYAKRSDPRCLEEVFLAVAQNVGQQIKYARLVQDFSGPTIKTAFNLLCKARVIKKIPSTKPSGLPLKANSSDKKFKAIMVDVGLWQHLSGMKSSFEYAKQDLLNIHRGAMAEHFIGQEMLVAQAGEFYYWSRDARNSSAEVDYLAVVGSDIHGVEVKSGAAGKLRSLHLMHEKYPNTGEGLVFSMAPYAELPQQKIKFIPLYFALSATQRQTVSFFSKGHS
jgi:predicted AAA+ superfamily ATPase